MSKYYLKDHVTDEMLQAVGFTIVSNSWGYWAVRNLFSDGNEVIIVLLILSDDYLKIMGYPYDKDVTPIIQDLIKLDYVEVRND